jgi:hypothetical protein
MVHVLILQLLQGGLRFFEDLLLPGEQLGAEIFALPLVHEGLFLRGPVTFEFVQHRSRIRARQPKGPTAAQLI